MKIPPAEKLNASAIPTYSAGMRRKNVVSPWFLGDKGIVIVHNSYEIHAVDVAHRAVHVFLPY
jgi:hypothetical protein